MKKMMMKVEVSDDGDYDNDDDGDHDDGGE